MSRTDRRHGPGAVVVRGLMRAVAVGLVALLAGVVVLGAAPGDSAITVTTTADEGLGSLRWAIEVANALPGEDAITFAIQDPGDADGNWRIDLDEPLPAVTEALAITGPVDGDGLPRVLLSGDDLVDEHPDAIGLHLLAPTTLHGLALGGFAYAVLAASPDAPSMLHGLHLGPTGAVANTAANHVGVLVTGQAVVGAAGPDQPRNGNVIRGNRGDAVEVVGAEAVATVRGNSITGNGGVGIDLDPDERRAGVVGDPTPNDAGDDDDGPNGLVNTPALMTAHSGGGRLLVVGTMQGRAGGVHTIDLYTSPACDRSGFGEGATWLGEVAAVPDSGGTAAIVGVLDHAARLGEAITATATTAEGTSEFSSCVGVTLPASQAADPEPGAAPRPGEGGSPGGTPGPRPAPDPVPAPTEPVPAEPAPADRAPTEAAPAAPTEATSPPPPPAPQPSPSPAPQPSPSSSELSLDQGRDDPALVARQPRPRSSMSSSVPLPALERLKSGLTYQTLALAGALVLVLGFSSAVFNETLKANRTEVEGWFAFASPVTERVGGGLSIFHPLALLVVAFAARGVISSFLEPSFPGGGNSGVLYLGLTLGAASLFLSAYGLVLVIERIRKGLWGRLKVVPVGWIVAIAMVLASRAMAFLPGYMYGATMKLHLPTEVDDREAGRLIATAYSFLLVLAGSAFLGRGLLASALAQEVRPMWVDVVDLILVVIVVAGTEFTSFALLPIAGLDGPVIRGWSKKAWFVIWGTGVVGFVNVVLAPEFGFWRDDADAFKVYALFGFFLIATTLFWTWFRIPGRPGQPSTAAEQPVSEDAAW